MKWFEIVFELLEIFHEKPILDTYKTHFVEVQCYGSMQQILESLHVRMERTLKRSKKVHNYRNNVNCQLKIVGFYLITVFEN